MKYSKIGTANLTQITSVHSDLLFLKVNLRCPDNWRIGTDVKWYYMADSGAMAKNKWAIWNEELYRLTEDGSMFEGRFNLRSDEKGALQIREEGANELGYIKDGLAFLLRWSPEHKSGIVTTQFA